jgi:hypothetical protein
MTGPVTSSRCGRWATVIGCLRLVAVRSADGRDDLARVRGHQVGQRRIGQLRYDGAVPRQIGPHASAADTDERRPTRFGALRTCLSERRGAEPVGWVARDIAPPNQLCATVAEGIVWRLPVPHAGAQPLREAHSLIGMSAPRRGVVVCVGEDARHDESGQPEGQDHYRCQDTGGPGGQRCQLLVEHDTPAHIASSDGTFRAWADGIETTLPPSPYPWFVSFPPDERLCGHLVIGKVASADGGMTECCGRAARASVARVRGRAARLLE